MPDIISADTDERERRAANELEKQLGRWPRRLLHVPSMTSYHWQPGDIYGSVHAPKYNALSYTWGRYREKDESSQVPTIQIKGITWSVPKIQPAHFDAQKLETAIRESTSRDYGGDEKRDLEAIEFLWIDIACIDQGGNINSDFEIGRQAQIFRNAHHVYIWLGHTPMAQLKQLQAFSNFWGAMKEDYNPARYNKAAFDRAKRFLKDLQEEPWFSSVWTLQEAYLRKDAILLSGDANPARVLYTNSTVINSVLDTNSNEHFQLRHLLVAFDAVWAFCWQGTPDLQPIQVVELLTDLGIVAMNWNDPMCLYAAAASREPEDKLDCIYGIQQIFDLRLGKTDPSKRSRLFTLDQLEDELGEALMRDNPVLSQNFVHTNSELQIGKRWRLSPHLGTPNLPFHYDTPWSYHIYDPRCKLSTALMGDLLCGWFEGSVCDFVDLQLAWKTRHLKDPRAGLLEQPIVCIQLDVGSELFMRIPMWKIEHNGTGARADEVYDLRVAELLVKYTNPDNNFDCDDPRSLKILHLGEHNSTENGCHFGLMLFRSIHKPVEIWRRVGICAWLGPFSRRYGPVTDPQVPFAGMSPRGELGNMSLGPALTEQAVSHTHGVPSALSGRGDAWQILSGYFG